MKITIANPHFKIVFLLMLTLSALFPPLPSLALADEATDYQKTAILYTENIFENGFLKTKIFVDPGKNAINAVGIYLDFSSSTLEVIELDFHNSFCQLFIKNDFDNQAGQVRILCGLPNPGISEIGEIGEIKFLQKNQSSISLDFNKQCQILANDGKGTDSLGEIINFKNTLE